MKDGEGEPLVVLDPARVKRRGGRDNPMYSERLAAEICEVIGASDLSIETLARQRDHWPAVQTLYEWRYKHRAFDEAFAQAEAMRASRFMHQLVEIADDDSRDLIDIGEGRVIPNNAAVTRDRLRTETRLKAAARFDPQRFGDRVEQNIRVGFIPLDEAIHQLK